MPDRDAGARPSGALLGVLAGVLAFMLLVLALIAMDEEDDRTADRAPLQSSPVPTVTQETAGEEGATAAPGGATPTPTAEPLPEPTDRDPTDADAAAFSSSYVPPGATGAEFVTVDVTADGRNEVVVVSIAGGAVRLDVAVWNGLAYDVVFTDQGGPAEAITDFTVRDVTGDDWREIVTFQNTPERESLSLWGWDGTAFAGQAAQGGCWDGSHTYGWNGAAFVDGAIHATCDVAGLELPAGTSDVYTWQGAWVHERTEAP